MATDQTTKTLLCFLYSRQSVSCSCCCWRKSENKNRNQKKKSPSITFLKENQFFAPFFREILSLVYVFHSPQRQSKRSLDLTPLHTIRLDQIIKIRITIKISETLDCCLYARNYAKRTKFCNQIDIRVHPIKVSFDWNMYRLKLFFHVCLNDRNNWVY